LSEGVRVADFYVQHLEVIDGMPYQPSYTVTWSEEAFALPAFCALARCTGENRYRALGERYFRRVAEATQADSGLWRHWTDPERGREGAFWSRGSYWPLFSMTLSLLIGDGDDAFADLLRSRVRTTLDGLMRVQDPAAHRWHLVLDEPETRLESSATAGIVYCHDRLRELGAIQDGYVEAMDRAYRSLKRLYYHGGLASNCRGTSIGPPQYYRTRPMGWYDSSLFGATVANRL
jgi:rhamnogalacturonyl hydrolase YesR